MNKITTTNKGTITLGSKVMVSDPCYGLGTWCQGVLDNVLPGEYECCVEHSDEGDWGMRVAAIEVTHSEYINTVMILEQEDFEVGVDSGQAGIFDYDYYVKYHSDRNDREHVDEVWYDQCYEKTHEYIENPDYIPFTETDEYKACMYGFRKELNKLSEKYPELDVDKKYTELIEHYNDLESPNPPKVDVNDLLETLRELKEMLSEEYVAPKITEEESELISINNKWSLLLSKSYEAHRRNKTGIEELFCFTANPIGEHGFVSSSGYGDGGYCCWTARNKDEKVIYIRVEFITEEDWEE
jgi:hypothetical protein